MLGEFCDWQPGVTAELFVSDDKAEIVEQRIDIAARTGNLPDSGLIARRRRICATTSAGVTCVPTEGGGAVDVLSARSGRLDRRARLRRQIVDSRYRRLKAARPGGSALTLLRMPRRAVIAAMAVMTLVIFPLAAFPVAAAVVVAIAMPANDHCGRRSNHDGRRRDDDRCGRADVDVDVDGVGEAGQRKAEAGEGKGDQRALHVLFRGVVIKGRRDAMEARGPFHRGERRTDTCSLMARDGKREAGLLRRIGGRQAPDAGVGPRHLTMAACVHG